MAIEFELKFSATPEQLAAVADAHGLDYRVIEMETTYYDTPDFALSDRHITLRRRMENGESVCTVKTPVSGYGRGEWECRCGDIQTGIEELCRLGAPEALRQLAAPGVKAVCGARFTRRAGDLEFGDARLELALDQGVLLGGGRQIPLCEVEVELKGGAPERAVLYGKMLSARFRLEPQEKSKFRRALSLAKGE